MNFGADLDLMECERAVQRGMVAAQDTGSGARLAPRTMLELGQRTYDHGAPARFVPVLLGDL